MSNGPGTGKLIRFGPYEADLAAGELRKGGRVIRLQEQPFQVLATLLDRSGEVVTREELRERLWAGDTFVDFDQGLNTAISKLREALGDSTANPRFIETLPKRGYRFLSPIEPDGVARAGPAGEDHPDPARKLRLKLRYTAAAAVVFASAAAGFAGLWLRRPAREPQLPLRRFSIRLPAPMPAQENKSFVAISPNGKQIAFVAGNEGGHKLWIQDLDQQQPRVVEGSEGARGPFWSPGSDFIGFGTDGDIRKVSAAGGPVTRVTNLPAEAFYGASWGLDGRSIVYASGDPSLLYEVPAAGGTGRVVLSQETIKAKPAQASGRRDGRSGYVLSPHFLPAEAGPRILAFALGCATSAVVLQELDAGQGEVLGPGAKPFYSPTGHLFYVASTESSDIWAVPLSPGRLRPLGEAFLVARRATDPTVSADGTLAYVDAISQQMVWLDRRGVKIGTAGQPAQGVFYPALSPDGRFAAVETLENGNLDVWIYDITRGARTRITSDPATDILPAWSPTGEELAFSSYRAGNIDIFVRRADGSAEERALPATSQHERVSDWSRDGEHIIYSLRDSKNGFDLWYLKRLDGGGWEPLAFLRSSFNDRAPKFSPDGRYVAYLSDESGRDEAYVRSFPDGQRKWPVSTNGASQIRWSRNGGELFYAEGGTLVAVPVRTAPEFTAGPPKRLFSHAAFTATTDPNYDVSADGQRILLPETVEGRERMIHVVQNWFAAFRDRGRSSGR